MGKSVIKKEDINWSQAQQVKSNAYKIVILIPNIPGKEEHTITFYNETDKATQKVNFSVKSIVIINLTNPADCYRVSKKINDTIKDFLEKNNQSTLDNLQPQEVEKLLQQQIPESLKAISIAVDMYNFDTTYQEDNLIPVTLNDVSFLDVIGLYKRNGRECKATLIQQGEKGFLNSEDIEQKSGNEVIVLKNDEYIHTIGVEEFLLSYSYLDGSVIDINDFRQSCINIYASGDSSFLYSHL
ncbi:MAG: hypothetical protein LN588_00070 [Rickettsia endosymbiont of Bryobia graminum]|nr:hypothetical protein [Rickettsia endosymbiont of Bryobia graminum]